MSRDPGARVARPRRDPREFCCLHRDLAAIFRPTDEVASKAVELLARTWWQKARHLRQWVGAGAPACPEIDARLDASLGVVLVAHARAPPALEDAPGGGGGPGN